MTLEIQVLAWNRHKNVAGLNQLMECHLFLSATILLDVSPKKVQQM